MQNRFPPFRVFRVFRGYPLLLSYAACPRWRKISNPPSAEGSTNRLNEQLAYSFDPAGNLNFRTNNALVQNFVVNSNNELTSAATSGTLTVMGTTTSAATNVTVNGTAASRYGDATFAAAGLSLTSSYTAVASDTNGRWATNTVNVDLATSVPFQYDLNGNLTNDGLRSFAYDDENQLIQVWVPGQWSSVFTYDGKMRRRIRQEFTWQGGAWVQTNAVYYVYDGNLVVQERDVNNLPTTTYTRGKDLSGSIEAGLPRQSEATAGGIGGLLARTAQSYIDAPLAGHAFYHADGNGNVTMLVNSSQAVVAKYLYDAFGNVLSASGLLADANRYQFSSKEKYLNSGIVYYLYRFYDPSLQRWPNRDPLGEPGFGVLRTYAPSSAAPFNVSLALEGVNLYEFGQNRPPNLVDTDGRCVVLLAYGVAAVTGWLVGYFLAEAVNPPESQPNPHDPFEPDPEPPEPRFQYPPTYTPPWVPFY